MEMNTHTMCFVRGLTKKPLAQTLELTIKKDHLDHRSMWAGVA